MSVVAARKPIQKLCFQRAHDHHEFADEAAGGGRPQLAMANSIHERCEFSAWC